MSVDDVQFLKDNGTSDSLVLFVDSAKRDMRAYPTPAEYVVRFEEPVKMVHGLEILDGTVPSTMYNIDIGRNMLKSYFFDEDSTFDQEGGTSTPELFQEFGLMTEMARYLEQDTTKDILVVSNDQYSSATSDGGFAPEPPPRARSPASSRRPAS